MHGQTRRYSSRTVVILEYDHEKEKGAYHCTVATPEGSRKIVVNLSPTEQRELSYREMKSTQKLSSIAVSAIHFAIDEDERSEPSNNKDVDDISTMEYCVLDENGDIEVFVRRIDSPGQSVHVERCGQPHDIRTGKPIDHSCLIYPVEALYGLQMAWRNGKVLVDSFLEGKPVVEHSVVYMDEVGNTIENVLFNLWFPDGPKSRTTFRFDTALRACQMVEHCVGKKRKGKVVGGIEVVSEKITIPRVTSDGIWR